MKFDVSWYSDCGGRKNNEDAVSVRVENDRLLAIVADGVGGYEGGELASDLTVATMNSRLSSASLSEVLLEESIEAANDEIYRLHQGSRRAMSTVAALWIEDASAIASNVGDSRIYQFRDGQIIFQSTDHSVSQLAVLVGEISPEQIRTHPERNRLIRVLGSMERPRVDSSALSVSIGDRFILCSDGFWENVREQDMLRLADSSTDAASWLNAMRPIAASRENADDNHTAIAVIIGE